MMIQAILSLHNTLPPASTFSFSFTRSISEGFTRFSKAPEKSYAQREYNNVSHCLCMRKHLSGETNERYEHAGFGYGVDGRVISSVSRQCSYCCAKCSNQVDASFNAWCIPTDSSFSNFQKAGEVDDDPSIIYFLPGREEAILDDFVRDTIRLSCSTEAICSDACEKSGLGKWEFDDEKSNSIDKRWLPILKANIN
jgi:hypothetical protein